MPELSTRGTVQNVEIRNIDEETRTATFVAATENGVMTYIGLDVLRMSGINTTRYKKNPIVLDSHKYYSGIDAIVGTAKISVEDRKLIAEVTFAEVERGELAWQLVKTKVLKTLSIGFERKKWLDIEDGESDGAGDDKIDGPARITTKWNLLEISVVPLPADEDALMREFMEWKNGREQKMNQEREETQAGDPGEETTKPAAAPEARQAETSSPAPEVEVSKRKAAILDITPPGLEEIAKQAIAAGKTVEETRALFLAELAKSTKPVGTPPPAEIVTGDGEPKLEDVSDETLTRSLTG